MSMVVSVPAFVVVIALGHGNLYGYLGVCMLTGFALGADLSLPAALVARLIKNNGDQGKNEGTYFGLYNWVNKLNLALAPTLALGTLQWFNYSPQLAGSGAFLNLPLAQQIAQDPLIWVYALIPCLLKLCAILLLYTSGLLQAPTPKRTAAPKTESGNP
ncbi:MAG: hypothetical protein HC848_05100 [Limnobacter sp.]|nr:hypothetical protein [Limnobacter sp.]